MKNLFQNFITFYLKVLHKIYHSKILAVYDVGAMHLEMKSSGMHARESRRGLKGTLMVSSEKSAAQGQVENHNTYSSSIFKNYFFF